MSGSPDPLEAARETLLGECSKTLNLLDKLLGVGILAAGPVGPATGHAWLIAAWGRVDQKSELTARLEETVGAGWRPRSSPVVRPKPLRAKSNLPLGLSS
jgi:hypothetical protein